MKKFGKNWYNGKGERIYNPRAYFNAVRRNQSRYKSYNNSYSNNSSKRFSNSCNDSLHYDNKCETAEMYGTTVEEVARDCGLPESSISSDDIREWAGD